jgi:hypothetical protein
VDDVGSFREPRDVALPGPVLVIHFVRIASYSEGLACFGSQEGRLFGVDQRGLDVTDRLELIHHGDSFVPDAFSRWAVLGSNQRPLRCKCDASESSYQQQSAFVLVIAAFRGVVIVPLIAWFCARPRTIRGLNED